MSNKQDTINLLLETAYKLDPNIESLNEGAEIMPFLKPAIKALDNIIPNNVLSDPKEIGRVIVSAYNKLKDLLGNNKSYEKARIDEFISDHEESIINHYNRQGNHVSNIKEVDKDFINEYLDNYNMPCKLICDAYTSKDSVIITLDGQAYPNFLTPFGEAVESKLNNITEGYDIDFCPQYETHFFGIYKNKKKHSSLNEILK